MRSPCARALAFAAAALAAACATLEPALPKAQPEIPAQWPIPPQTSLPQGVAPQETHGTRMDAVADIGWREFFTDEKLAGLIARALEQNRDLRVAVLNVERARELYRVQRAARVPSVDAAASLSRTGGNHPQPDLYTADIGITGFELDLFGRVRSLSDAALQQFFAQQEARRAAQLSLVAEVANAYFTLASDRESLRLAQATLGNQDAAFALTVKRHDAGAVSGLDLYQARTAVESARADEARFAGQVVQDLNALVLLVGAADTDSRLGSPASAFPALRAIPAGLPSEVLLRRPDVLQAERVLRSANASIGAARASFFPSIHLTGTVGTASTELSGLFRGGSFAWTFVPAIDLPIFQGGRLEAQLGSAVADRDIALAQYEKAIQAAFRETADALALSSTLVARVAAEEAFVEAAAQSERLSRARYEAGRDSFLVLLDAQRTLYSAQQGLIAVRLAEQSNRVALYKALGGGWK